VNVHPARCDGETVEPRYGLRVVLGLWGVAACSWLTAGAAWAWPSGPRPGRVPAGPRSLRDSA